MSDINKRTIIIVWKWKLHYNEARPFINTKMKSDYKFDFIKNNNPFELKVEDNNCKIIGFTKSHSYPDWEEKKLKTHNYTIDNIIEKCEELCKDNIDNKVLLLLHEGEHDHFFKDSVDFKKISSELEQKFSENIYIDTFGSGSGNIYAHLLEGDKSYLKEDSYIYDNIYDNEILYIKTENFNKVWDAYYGKKKIISELKRLWLPLAIDIAGLSTYAWKILKLENLFDHLVELSSLLDQDSTNNSAKKQKIKDIKSIINALNNSSEQIPPTLKSSFENILSAKDDPTVIDELKKINFTENELKDTVFLKYRDEINIDSNLINKHNKIINVIDTSKQIKDSEPICDLFKSFSTNCYNFINPMKDNYIPKYLMRLLNEFCK